MSQIAAEFGGSTPHSLSEYRVGYDGIPASGTIAFSDLRGTSVIDVLPIKNTSGVNNFNTIASGIRTDPLSSSLVFAIPAYVSYGSVAGDLGGSWSASFLFTDSRGVFYTSSSSACSHVVDPPSSGSGGLVHSSSNNTDFRIGSGKTATYEGWFRWDDVSYQSNSAYRYNYCFSYYGYSGGDRGWELKLYNSKLNFVTYPNATEHVGSTQLSDDTWYHIALVFNGTNVKCYVNGVQHINATFTAPSYATHSGNNEMKFSIGSSYWDGTFNGAGSDTWIQDVRMYAVRKYTAAFSIP